MKLLALLLLVFIDLNTSNPVYIKKFFGVNIHFREQRKPGEVEQISNGFGAIRMDFTWDAIETKKGVYDFSQYDTLYSELNQYKLQPYWILDYSNSLYVPDGNSPRTPAERQAFVNFVVAALDHFHGKGIIWEIWNEPNGRSFWHPTPNATQYGALAVETCKAMKMKYPQEAVTGPTTSGFDFNFIEEVFKMGLLDCIDAVSVHPYRKYNPETAVDDGDYANLTTLIRKYSKMVVKQPIISSEWGYSPCQAPCNGGYVMSNNTQAKYLVRMMLMNSVYTHGSIFYDWLRPSSSNPHTFQQDWGVVSFPFTGNSSAPWHEMLAYKAAAVLHSYMKNAGEYGRVQGSSPAVWIVLLTQNDGSSIYALWCAKKVAGDPNPSQPQCERNVVLELEGNYDIIDMYGKNKGPCVPDDILVSDEPIYLAPKK